MYCEYYDFREKPFTITPNPRFIFLSKNHQEAFAHLLYGIDNHVGFIELTGEVGTGKTTVLRTLLGDLDESSYRTALIFNPCLSAIELLRSINHEYGIPGEGLSNAELLQELNRFLLRENAAGHTIVLVIDEAQNLDSEVLEQIRLISNLETENDKLIQIVLAGQPELGRLLERPELRQLAQRITVRYHLLPMDFEDLSDYIHHRMTVAGCGRAVYFTPAALKRIFRYSGGIPRLINIVCDRALLIGYVEEHREISSCLIKSAISEIRRGGSFPCSRQLLWRIGFCLLLIIVAGCLYAARNSLQPATFKPLAKPIADSMSESVKPLAPTFVDAARGEAAGIKDAESALGAFNVLARKWNVQPATVLTAEPAVRGLILLARQKDMRLLKIQGNLKLLLRFDTPALLEFKIPVSGESRFIALTGTVGERWLIEPSLLGRNSFTTVELESLWSGRAYLLWKNFLGIPVITEPSAKGSKVIELQRLLGEQGVYKGKQTGILDVATINALKSFQRAKGISTDSRVGGLTLLLLYRENDRFTVPGLTRKKGGNQG
jgi:general secretion pathway protein A